MFSVGGVTAGVALGVGGLAIGVLACQGHIIISLLFNANYNLAHCFISLNNRKHDSYKYITIDKAFSVHLRCSLVIEYPNWTHLRAEGSTLYCKCIFALMYIHMSCIVFHCQTRFMHL